MAASVSRLSTIMPRPEQPLEERILILASTRREGSLTSKMLAEVGLPSEICQNMMDLCRELERGAGAVLISLEVLEGAAARQLRQILAKAPAWSDLPLLILTKSEGEPVLPGEAGIESLGNVTFLERPIRAQTLVTGVDAALRARRRQYQIRDLLWSQQQAVQRMDMLAAVASHLLLSERPEEMVGSVFGKIATQLGLEVYLFYLLDERNQRLELNGQFGLPADIGAQQQWFDLHASLCGAVARDGKRVVAENVQLSSTPENAVVKAMGITAYACFPLLVNERLIGTLSFGTGQRDRFGQEELAVLETVCNQVAVALERQRTEQALQELNQLLEKRVAERTAQLQESHEQMEAFSYSISHDLRAPLRAIRGFAQALLEDYGPTLDEVGREYLARMGEGAERLDKLIQDLLQYSRLGRSTLSSEPVALEELVRQVLVQLETDVQSSGAVVDIHKPLARVLCHPPTLEQVLMNLLSNALKFVAPGVKPRIRIWGSENAGKARLWIGDNGIGIAPAQHQRIFGVFERLHTTEAYPGTGIGLAIVAKGVTRMGGSAGVESAVGEGSRFWVELPKAPEVDPGATE